MKTITLLIPCYNESQRIKHTIETLKSNGFHFSGLKLKELIFVNDGSTDNTLRILRAHKKSLENSLCTKVTILSYPVNQGRGFAVRHGAAIATTDYVIYTDADFSIPLSNITKCLPCIKNNYGLIFGSKKKPGAVETIRRSWLRRIVGYGHSILVSPILGTFAWDYQGGFKIFSKNFINTAFPMLSIPHWGFDMEVIFAARKLKFKTQEIPVTWGHVENDSKVKLLRDSWQALSDAILIRQNWNQALSRALPCKDCPQRFNQQTA